MDIYGLIKKSFKVQMLKWVPKTLIELWVDKSELLMVEVMSRHVLRSWSRMVTTPLLLVLWPLSPALGPATLISSVSLLCLRLLTDSVNNQFSSIFHIRNIKDSDQPEQFSGFQCNRDYLMPSKQKIFLKKVKLKFRWVFVNVEKPF